MGTLLAIIGITVLASIGLAVLVCDIIENSGPSDPWQDD